jgi:hypothetical protein
VNLSATAESVRRDVEFILRVIEADPPELLYAHAVLTSVVVSAGTVYIVASPVLVTVVITFL